MRDADLSTDQSNDPHWQGKLSLAGGSDQATRSQILPPPVSALGVTRHLCLLSPFDPLRPEYPEAGSGCGPQRLAEAGGKVKVNASHPSP